MIGQFIVYSADKKPRSPYTGDVCDPHDPANHSDRGVAEAAVALGLGVGVGFVFTAHDPYFFLDIDHCGPPWSPLAEDLCRQFAGCYVEVSRSGTGLHIIGTGGLPQGHRTRCQQHGLELYTTGRYCALTGIGASGDWSYPAQAPLDAVYSTYFAPLETEGGGTAEWTDGPCPEWSGPEDDQELLLRMLNSRPSIASVMGSRATVTELWDGQTDAYGGNHSHADQALLTHLAFWTGKDCERMVRLFSQSGLCRDKWLDREDYRRISVLNAVASCRNVYGAPSNPTPPEAGDDAPSRWKSGAQILTITQQVEHFKGCCYICDLHRVLTPDGSMLKPEQFRAMYGGYMFALGSDASKTTKSAWEAFTESQGYDHPKAHSMCFRPEMPPGEVFDEGGWKVVNTYVPIQTLRKSGDVSPFTGLITKLLPNDRDREILLSYMAAVVQYPGRKFQWWPVLQGTEGNGKSAIIRVLSHAVGSRYTHLPNPDSMAKTGNQFNSWVVGKLFVGIEEIYVPERRDFLEAFKTTVTNDRIQIEGKGSNQVMGDNRANGVMCTNHKDGVPTTVDTRRYAILYSAQQSKEDKLRDGMGGDYFPHLYEWFRGDGKYEGCGLGHGYAIVNDFLRSYRIAEEFNPAGLCQEAPGTSSTAEAVQLSMGAVEQEILEAIAQGRAGFAGGWISSLALDRLLDNMRMSGRIPRNKRKTLLEGMGYTYHPALVDGWTNNAIAGEGGRTRLYIRRGHLASNLRSCSEVVKHYTDAQAGLTSVFSVDNRKGAL